MLFKILLTDKSDFEKSLKQRRLAQEGRKGAVYRLSERRIFHGVGGHRNQREGGRGSHAAGV